LQLCNCHGHWPLPMPKNSNITYIYYSRLQSTQRTNKITIYLCLLADKNWQKNNQHKAIERITTEIRILNRWDMVRISQYSARICTSHRVKFNLFYCLCSFERLFDYLATLCAALKQIWICNQIFIHSFRLGDKRDQ